MRLAGKVALISGAAAGLDGEVMGIGGATAREFAREGARVVVSDIDEELGQRTAQHIHSEGGEACFVRLDVTSEYDWQEALRIVRSTYGAIDVLVNSAGSGGGAPVEDTTSAMWDAQMDVNAKGVFLGTKLAIPEMRAAGGGSIVNISSIYGMVGSPSSTAYHAAKGAVRSFTKAAAVQYAAEGIRINSVHPGFCHTALSDLRYRQDPARRERAVSQTPLGRLGRAHDIAHGVLYLASDQAAFMTGAELVIDGGVTAQ